MEHFRATLLRGHLIRRACFPQGFDDPSEVVVSGLGLIDLVAGVLVRRAGMAEVFAY
jgi:threonine dehydrogenase-like Zn-dependent dehydrogenase